MRKLLIICFCFLSVISHGSDTRVIGKDYSLTDIIVRPVSVGVTSWTDKEYGTITALYSSICCMSYKNKIRLELGTSFTVQDKFDVVPITGISTSITEDFILGAWYAPFWNLYNPFSSDDPWGIMLGYRF